MWLSTNKMFWGACRPRVLLPDRTMVSVEVYDPAFRNPKLLNEEIRDKEVRLIGSDGAQLGIVSSAEANAMAEEQGLDLVKISPNAVPPVCKIMDYSKFCFDQKKREKEAKKNQRVVEIKEIRMSPSIDTNDFNTKTQNNTIGCPTVTCIHDAHRGKAFLSRSISCDIRVPSLSSPYRCATAAASIPFALGQCSTLQAAADLV